MDDTLVSGATRSRPRPLALAAAGLVLALLSAVGTYLLTKQPLPATAAPGFPPLSGTTIKLPDGELTVYEQPSDPVRLTSLTLYEYRDGSNEVTLVPRAYVRQGATFAKVGGNGVNATISPDGKWLVVVDEMYSGPGRLQIRVTNRSTGETFSVTPELTRVQSLIFPEWSPDGGRLLFTLADHTFGGIDHQVGHTGFAILDPAARTASVTQTYSLRTGDDTLTVEGVERDLGFYHWGPDGYTVATSYALNNDKAEYGTRLMDLSGRTLRPLHWVGRPVEHGLFSPSGRRFYASRCWKSSGTEDLCVWDLTTGKGLATNTTVDYTPMGWYDEDHLIVMKDVTPSRPNSVTSPKALDVYVTDFHGKPIKLLAKLRMPGNTDLTSAGFRYAPTPR